MRVWVGEAVVIATNADIRLVMRAMRSGWNVPDEVKQDCVAQLASIAAGAEKDSDRVAAIKALMMADAIDHKREKADEDRRLRMVELAQRIPAGELAKLASDRGIVIDGTAQVINGRAGQPVAEDGSEASEGEGLNDTQAGQS